MPIIIDGEKWYRTDEFYFDKQTGNMVVKEPGVSAEKQDKEVGK